jgi:hypothetical protein
MSRRYSTRWRAATRGQRDESGRFPQSHYASALLGATLAGKRLGVLRYATGSSPALDAVFARALVVLRAHGARIVELKAFRPAAALADAETTILMTELKVDLGAYLATTPRSVRTRSSPTSSPSITLIRASSVSSAKIFRARRSDDGLGFERIPKGTENRAKLSGTSRNRSAHRRQSSMRS